MYSDEQIIDALQKTGGNQAAAARALDCSRNTIRKRIKDSEGVKEAYDEVNEANLDRAENELIDLVNSGDFKAIRFYLRTKGRHRGYGDKMDITTNDESLNAFRVEIVNAKDEG